MPMQTTLSSLSVAQLTRAIEIKQKIETLEQELAGLLGTAPVTASVAAPVATPVAGRGKYVRSPAARARMAAAQKARWAKKKGVGAAKAAAPRAGAKPKKFFSPAARRALSAAAKARWAKARASGRHTL
jgi:hypothetical protein